MPFLFIRKDSIGFIDFLHLISSLCLFTVTLSTLPIRMIFHGKFSVSPFDILLRGILINS